MTETASCDGCGISVPIEFLPLAQSSSGETHQCPACRGHTPGEFDDEDLFWPRYYAACVMRVGKDEAQREKHLDVIAPLINHTTVDDAREALRNVFAMGFMAGFRWADKIAEDAKRIARKVPG